MNKNLEEQKTQNTILDNTNQQLPQNEDMPVIMSVQDEAPEVDQQSYIEAPVVYNYSKSEKVTL